MRNSMISAVALVLGITITYSNSNAGIPTQTLLACSSALGAPAQSKTKVTVPAGTRILIRTIDPIDTTKQKTGYRFTASLETNLQWDDVVVAPRGTTVYGRLAEASSA